MSWLQDIFSGEVSRSEFEAQADMAMLLAESDARSIENCMRTIETLHHRAGALLIEKNIVDKAQLDEFVDQLDAEDGVADGKMPLPPAPTPTTEPQELNPIAKNLRQEDL